MITTTYSQENVKRTRYRLKTKHNGCDVGGRGGTGRAVVAARGDDGVVSCHGGGEWRGVVAGGRSGGDAMIGGGVHRLWRPEVLPEMETAAGKLGRKKGGAGNLWREECVFRVQRIENECEIDCAADGKLRNKNADECREIIENLALYDHEGWNDSKEFIEPVKAISTPQSTSKTPDQRLLELEDQINFLLKGS
ncbi:hypothetical protein Tco_0539318 [Tanacetum coccineum]